LLPINPANFTIKGTPTAFVGSNHKQNWGLSIHPEFSAVWVKNPPFKKPELTGSYLPGNPDI
jgi:hypothetical protein